MDKKTIKLLNKRLAGPRFLKHVDVRDVDEYFDLPKSQREIYGLYRKPIALPMERISNVQILKSNAKGWAAWETEIKKQYPIQWFFREWILSWDNPVYAFIKSIYFDYVHFQSAVKRFIKPFYPRFRKSMPRHKYCDVSEALRKVTFSLILDFWYEEMVDGIVDWNDNNDHKKFFKAVKAAVKYIEIDRIKLQAQADKALTVATKSKKATFYERYSKFDALEKKIKDKDTALLVWAMQQREMFWT